MRQEQQATAYAGVEARHGIHPFWFWNGDLDDEELVRQITEMAEQGLGGFFICARQGMEIAYLSKEWFRKVRVAVEAAHRLGLEVWLYDEYPYPSGIAGGEVTLEHPDAKHHHLEHLVFECSGDAQLTEDLPWGHVVSVKAVPLDANGTRLWEQAIDLKAHIGNFQAEPVFQKTGLTAYNQKRFFTYRTVKRLHWTAPAGSWEVHAFVECEITDFKYYGTFVDPCHPEATSTFIKLTHQRYADEVGEYFGKTIKGMFTDETGFLGRIPWTRQLPGYFIEKYGYDIREHLGDLMYRESDRAAKVRYDYYQALHELLRERYHKPIHDWCERYGLQYVAEVPAMRMSTQLYSHVIGGDSAHEKLGRSLSWILDRYSLSMRANCKMVSSLARQLDRERALIECFHSVGWSMNLQDARWMIDRMAALGVNFFNFHAFFYTLDGMTQHDAPPSHFYQNPYWPHFHQLADYTSRISAVMSEGDAEISIALLDPTTTLWTYMGNPLHSFDYQGISEHEQAQLEQLKQDWLLLMKSLLLARRDYDQLDPEILARAVVEEGRIRLGRASYEVLILPPMTNLEAAARQKIEQFVQQGGTVIAYGLLPYEDIDGSLQTAHQTGGWEAQLLQAMAADASGTHEALNNMSQKYWNKVGATGQEETDTTISAGNLLFIPRESDVSTLLRVLDRVQPASVRLESSLADDACFLMQTRRTTDGQLRIFITNQEEANHETVIRIDSTILLDQGESLAAWELDLEDGSRRPVAIDIVGEELLLRVSFAPYEAHLLEIGKSEASVVSATPASASMWTIDEGLDWQVEAESLNAVRIDTFALSFDDQVAPHPVGVKTFIDQIGDLPTQPKMRLQQVFGTPQQLALHVPLDVRYKAVFTLEGHPPADCALLMDQAAILGEATIRINGHLIPAASWSAQPLYDNMNRVAPIASFLQPGDNQLEVEVRIEQDWHGLVDAMYIMGSFGVTHASDGQVVIGAPPVQSPLYANPYPHYPYYAGTLLFKRTVQLEQVPEREQFILQLADLTEAFHDSAEVTVNGHRLAVRPWSPYVWRGESEWLLAGANEIEVRITTTLIGLLEGKYFDYDAHQLRPLPQLLKADLA